MSHDIKSAERPAPDHLLAAIADYALSFEIRSELAYETAGYCLMDTLACGFLALKYPACTKLLGPVYTWMVGDIDAALARTDRELDALSLPSEEAGTAVDLLFHHLTGQVVGGGLACVASDSSSSVSNGLLPAALSTGIGSDTQKPFAIVIVAGLISRLFLGFFVNPVLYEMVAKEGDVLQV